MTPASGIGDLVVVFGLGVPGQIVLQAARASGRDRHRRRPGRRAAASMALRLGADRVLDPTAGSVADVVKSRDRRPRRRRLHRGLAARRRRWPRRCARSPTPAASSPWGSSRARSRGLRLGDEFHHNRIELISSQISGVAPDASHRWSKLRLWQTAVRLQHEGRLDLLPLITDEVPFAEAPDAVRSGSTRATRTSCSRC